MKTGSVITQTAYSPHGETRILKYFGKKIANFILRINYCVQLIYTVFQALVSAFFVVTWKMNADLSVTSVFIRCQRG